MMDPQFEVEEINDSWWDKLEENIKNRTWLEKIYWWSYHHIYRPIKDSYYYIIYTPYRLGQYWKRGFPDKQLWSLDVTIAKFVAPRLKRLKEIKFGHPIIEVDKNLCLGCWTYPEMWNRELCPWDPKGDFHLDSEQIWNEILDKMIFAMESIAINQDWDPPMDHIECSDIRQHNPKWEAYSKEREEHWLKLKEGLKLFGEYFGALWD